MNHIDSLLIWYKGTSIALVVLSFPGHLSLVLAVMLLIHEVKLTFIGMLNCLISISEFSICIS